MKYNISMCESCLECRDPKIYCKFRTACPIHFLTRRKGCLDAEDLTQDIAKGFDS